MFCFVLFSFGLVWFFYRAAFAAPAAVAECIVQSASTLPHQQKMVTSENASMIGI